MQGNNEMLLQLSKELNCRDLCSSEVLPADKEEDCFALSLLHVCVDG